LRKISPDGVRDDFRSQLNAIRAFHTTGASAFPAEADRSTLAEQTLLATAVAWEGFVSDMFIAYINRDATRFKKHLEKSFYSHLEDSEKSKRIFREYGTLVFPAHLNKADVLALADGKGGNITFRNFSELERRTKTWLVREHASKFSGLSASQKAVVNALVALRNHVAHRSQRSLDAMNAALTNADLQPTGIQRLQNQTHNVGAWLKAKPVGGTQSRLATIIQVLDDIAVAL